MIFPLIYGYFLFGVISAAVTYEMLPERFTVPDGEPALRFLSGLLWPFVLLCAASMFTFRVTRSVFFGFVALWRHARRTGLPKATALGKSPTPKTLT